MADLTDFGIILDFGAQLIKTNPDIALNIFTFDGEPEKWPRDKVYELFKSSKAPTQMRVPLIEHYIEQVNATSGIVLPTGSSVKLIFPVE